VQSSVVISSQTLTQIVPVFIAILVWVIRILIIASLTSAIERLSGKKPAAQTSVLHTNPSASYSNPVRRSQPVSAQPLNLTRNPRPAVQPKTEPTYHDLFASRNFSSNEVKQDQTKTF
jgi:hypothetical protein